MSRLVLPALAVLASICLPTITQAQMSPPEPKFTDHPVTTVYRGPVAAPAFTGPGKDWQAYRTRIRDGMRGGTTYAGQFAIIMIGCGAGCRFAAVADVRTGQLSSFPLGGEDNLYLQLDYRPDSKLVIAHWESKGRCIRQSYVWTGKDFRQIDLAEIGDERACAGRARS